MIPVRLEMKNFMPYVAPQPLRFEGIHLACLTGANGAGKSSVLDAITWALWGKSRAKRLDDLIHLGADEMLVQLDFEQEGVIYRVLRHKAAGKRSSATLELFLLAPDGGLTTIREPSTAGTQARINQILRMTYELFIDSAFLQQGRADSFTTRTPAERKAILSDILGLEIWKEYEVRARDALAGAQEQIRSLDLRIGEIEAELANEARYQDEVRLAGMAEAEARAALEAAQNAFNAVAHAPDSLRRAREQLAQIQRHQREYERDRAFHREQIEALTARIQTHQAVIDRRADIEAGYEKLQAARAESGLLAQKLRDIRAVENAIAGIEREISAQRNTLEQQRAGLQSTIDDQQRILQEADAAELSAVEARITQMEALEAERDARSQEVQAQRETLASLNSRFRQLEEEGNSLKARLETLRGSDESTCPLCGQPLAGEHKATLLAQIEGDVQSRREAYSQALDQRKALQAAVSAEEAALRAMGEELRELPRLRGQAGRLQQKADQIAGATQRQDEARARLAALDATLAAEDYAQELRQQQAALEEEQAALAYDQSSHDENTLALETFRDYDQQHHALVNALQQIADDETALANAHSRLEHIAEALAGDEAQEASLAGELVELEALEAEAQAREAALRASRTLHHQAQGRLVEKEQLLAALHQQRERLNQHLERREAASQQESVYSQLRAAFGRNGVPAMIIETAIPELEAEANSLLARMTSGRMHLRLTTQREKVTGGAMETLDIEIADELGTRSYEMYSGGEAFRINFAIRIALSKMLARRSGAHLRTLFIDEGFGSQDSEGRTRLVEAINTIKPDFDLILVITHIEELRDSFPVHIVVEKTDAGSQIAIQ
jgi:DNA repair protein SbcC/Rad50